MLNILTVIRNLERVTRSLLHIVDDVWLQKHRKSEKTSTIQDIKVNKVGPRAFKADHRPVDCSLLLIYTLNRKIVSFIDEVGAESKKLLSLSHQKVKASSIGSLVLSYQKVKVLFG